MFYFVISSIAMKFRKAFCFRDLINIQIYLLVILSLYFVVCFIFLNLTL